MQEYFRLSPDCFEKGMGKVRFQYCLKAKNPSLYLGFWLQFLLRKMTGVNTAGDYE